MSRVEKLKIAGEAYSVKFIELTRIYAKNKDAIICIFEGEDEKYYCNRISHAFNNLRWHGINSGGRDKALTLFDAIETHPIYSSSNHICFIDHDFLDWFVNTNPSKIYVTPCYSIENLYLSRDCFIKILSAEFNMSEFQENNNDFQNALLLYEKLKTEYYYNISTYNIWLKAYRIMQRDNKSVTKICANSKKLNSLLNINLNTVTSIYDHSDPNTAFNSCEDIIFCNDALNEAKLTLDPNNGDIFYRGKQSIEFLRVLLSLLKNDRMSKNPILFEQTGKVKLLLSKDNLTSELSQYADTPACLISFLDNYKKSIAA